MRTPAGPSKKDGRSTRPKKDADADVKKNDENQTESDRKNPGVKAKVGGRTRYEQSPLSSVLLKPDLFFSFSPGLLVSVHPSLVFASPSSPPEIETGLRHNERGVQDTYPCSEQRYL
jgi:hypothetical protein